MKKALLSGIAILSISVLLFACGAQEPLGIEDGSPDAIGVQATSDPIYSASDQSPCRDIEFTTRAVGAPPSFAGTVEGDLVGTIEVEVIGPPFVTDGVAIMDRGTALMTVHVTGGAVPELIGQTVEFILSDVVTLAPGQAPAFPMQGKGRANSGVESAHLTFHGVFDLSTFPFSVVHTYRGVICP